MLIHILYQGYHEAHEVQGHPAIFNFEIKLLVTLLNTIKRMEFIVYIIFFVLFVVKNRIQFSKSKLNNVSLDLQKRGCL